MILVHRNANELCPEGKQSIYTLISAFVIAFICIAFEFFFELARHLTGSLINELNKTLSMYSLYICMRVRSLF